MTPHRPTFFQKYPIVGSISSALIAAVVVFASNAINARNQDIQNLAKVQDDIRTKIRQHVDVRINTVQTQCSQKIAELKTDAEKARVKDMAYTQKQLDLIQQLYILKIANIERQIAEIKEGLKDD